MQKQTGESESWQKISPAKTEFLSFISQAAFIEWH
jgi:hypothetical protein